MSGASGLLGSALGSSFASEGVEVIRLTRGQPRDKTELRWSPMVPNAGLDQAAVSGFDAVVHLAGETVVGRWTEAKKKAIRESRVISTRNLSSILMKADLKPKIFACASAIGFYGDRGDGQLTEKSTQGRGFLADVCEEWEAASRVAADAGIRTVNLRTGLVLSNKGGALGNMLTPFKLGLGGRLGSGRQWWSWIHIDDWVGGVRHAITAEAISGPLNLVAPETVRNAEFTKTLASVLRRPAILPVPEFGLQIAFGKEAAREMFLASQRVSPQKLEESGYRFQHSELRGAIESLV